MLNFQLPASDRIDLLDEDLLEVDFLFVSEGREAAAALGFEANHRVAADEHATRCADEFDST